MADGQVALVTHHLTEITRINTTQEKTSKVTISIIDAEKRDWGDSFELDVSEYEGLDWLSMSVYNGFGCYSLCLADRNNLYGYDMETGEVDVLLNWKDSGINTDRSAPVILIDGEHMAVTYYSRT